MIDDIADSFSNASIKPSSSHNYCKKLKSDNPTPSNWNHFALKKSSSEKNSLELFPAQAVMTEIGSARPAVVDAKLRKASQAEPNSSLVEGDRHLGA